MVALGYFILLFALLILIKDKSVALIFIGIQIISLSGTFFLGLNYPINTFFKLFNLSFTLIVLSLIIIPWTRIVNVESIYCLNEKKLLRLTKSMIILSIVPFFTFLIVSIFVILYVEDINTFKYAEGVSTDFYYSLPINIRLLIFSNYSYNLSYFLIPLHFYYLSKKKYWLSFFCFLFSLNIILFGLTYFSRSVYIQYGSIYGAFLFILFPTLESSLRNGIKYFTIFFGIIFISYFIYISNARFESDNSYYDLIPSNAIIQDPVYYSYFDYASQWYFNSLIVMEEYNLNGFNGQITFQPVLSLLGQYGIIPYESSQYSELRMRLWPSHWWTFNGFVAYSVYDYGYFLTIILCFAYFYFVKFNRPVNNSVSILNLFVLVLLIQLPLMSIFYSNAAAILMPFLFLIPIYLYMKYKL